MNVRITPSIPTGKIKSIASKSTAHRLLICAAFADKATEIFCKEINEDISATVRCLNSLGAKITRNEDSFTVLPIRIPKREAALDCGESGSTLRFLLPVAAVLGCKTDFIMAGRLKDRPLSPLREELEAHALSFSEPNKNPLSISGRISAGEYRIRGDVSSQFISGLLFALSVTEGESRIHIEGRLESLPYVNMTLNALFSFGADIDIADNLFVIHGKRRLTAPASLSVEGDWSNAAFALCAGALNKKAKVSVFDLDDNSMQGDRSIIEILVRFGADVRRRDDCFTVRGGQLRGIELCAENIPDLVPVAAVVAAGAEGTTKIYGASRLKLKESDRLESVSAMLRALGGNVEKTDDGLIIYGTGKLSGGVVDSFGDHRIAMSAAVASVICDGEVLIKGADSAAKSYPSFWDDLATLSVTLIKE